MVRNVFSKDMKGLSNCKFSSKYAATNSCTHFVPMYADLLALYQWRHTLPVPVCHSCIWLSCVEIWLLLSSSLEFVLGFSSSVVSYLYNYWYEGVLLWAGCNTDHSSLINFCCSLYFLHMKAHSFPNWMDNELVSITDTLLKLNTTCHKSLQ
jgi:hypothetical protein